MYNGIPLVASAVAAVGGGYSLFKMRGNESLRIVGFALLANAVGGIALACITRKETVTVKAEDRHYKAWRLTIPLNMLTGLVFGGILAASAQLGPATKKIRAELLAAPILLGVTLSLFRGYLEYRDVGPAKAEDEHVFCCSKASFPSSKVSHSLFSTFEVAYNIQVATTLLIAGLALDARFSVSKQIAHAIWRVPMNQSLLLSTGV